jgi:hypothetical protein
MAEAMFWEVLAAFRAEAPNFGMGQHMCEGRRKMQTGGHGIVD